MPAEKKRKHGMTLAEVREQVRRDRAAAGLPPTVEDEAALRRIRALTDATRRTGAPTRSGGNPDVEPDGR